MNEFLVEYKFFLMDDDPEYDMFDFDDVGFGDFITNVVSTCDTSTISLDLEPLPSSLSMLVWVPTSLYL